MCLTAGCSSVKVNDISPILSGFRCDFSIENSKLSGELEVEGNGILTFSFQGDDIINGLKLQVKNEVIIVDVNGLTESYSRAEIPQASPAVYLFDALISAKQIKPQVNDNRTVIFGTSPSGKFELSIGPTGFIENILLDKNDVKIIFSNHSTIN